MPPDIAVPISHSSLQPEATSTAGTAQKGFDPEGLQDTAALPTLLPLVLCRLLRAPPRIPTRPELWAMFPCLAAASGLCLQPPVPHRNADPAWLWLGAAAGTWQVGADLGGELRNHSCLSPQT